MKIRKKDKMEYGYITYKKNTLLLQMLSMVAIGVTVFLLGLLLNKGDLANIFTVIAILFVLPAARYLTVWIVLMPFASAEKQEYQSMCDQVEEHGLLVSDLVFTSSERVMHLDYMVLAGGQAYCYMKPGKKQLSGKQMTNDETEKGRTLIKSTEEYLNQHFEKERLNRHAKIWEDEKAFLRAVQSHELTEGELEEQIKVRDTMRYFMV